MGLSVFYVIIFKKSCQKFGGYIILSYICIVKQLHYEQGKNLQ